MIATGGNDPRRVAAIEADIRPTVGRGSNDLSPWLFAGVVLVGAVLLFAVLDSGRRAREAPTIKARRADLAALPASPPPLFVPPVPMPAPLPPAVMRASPQPDQAPMPRSLPAPVTSGPAPVPVPIVPLPQPVDNRPNAPNAPVIVLDTSQGTSGGSTASTVPPANTAFAMRQSARAGQLRNKATTVPQGTLIPAVLETALDSTRPGQARALVSKDVRGFDGSRVLIQRGSRLFGEYRADLQPGQNRALVQWTRLVRPDGVTIAIDSPAADALGRAGIGGRVNSHFFERFGAAILQSSLDLGVNLAARSVGDGTFVYVPGASIGSAASPIQPRQVQPTLKVRQGVRVSVFVARDLDFSSVDTRP